jgi:hypothetical protein
VGPGHLHQAFGQPRRDIQEDQVVGHFVGIAKALGHGGQDLLGGLRSGLQQGQEIVTVKGQNRGVFGCYGTGGARTAVKEGQLAEEVSGLQQRHGEVAALLARQVYSDGPRLYDQERAAGIVLEEEGTAAIVLMLLDGGGQGLPVLVRQHGQKRNLPQ